jgi:hypothetical protein
MEKIINRAFGFLQLQRSALVYVGLSCFLSGCFSTSIRNGSDEFAGLWSLYKVEKKDSSDNWIEDGWMKNGTGYILYDGKGHMAVQIAPKGYNSFSWLTERENTNDKLVRAKISSLTESELKGLLINFSSELAYLATYIVNKDSNTIEHSRIVHSNPSAWSTKVIRRFRVSGDTLLLELPDGFRRLWWLRKK